MQAIGIGMDHSLIYEGDGSRGYGLWPSPAVSLAAVQLFDNESEVPAANNLFASELVFREDSFDPVTRIRRGRIYKTSGAQPQRWKVQPHPAYVVELEQDRNGWIDKELFTFYAWSAWASLPKTVSTPRIVLGTKEASTQWLIVDIERIVTGEDLLTLRARGALGILPEVNIGSVPDGARIKFSELYEKLSNSAYRSGAESIIDRARDLAQWSISAWLCVEQSDDKSRFDDLGELIKRIPDTKSILKDTARSLARLHARCKPNEQERRGTRVVTESDAEFALSGIGILLRELGWTR